MPDLKDRIKFIIDSEKLTYSKFADIIGVQRSGISHILSGRNNPSLEVIQKILEAFTFINTDWLLFGKGEMVKEIIQGKLFQEDNEINVELPPIEKVFNPESDQNSEPIQSIDQLLNSPPDKILVKEIERIVIFYNNKTFSDYKKE
jgi:transcriptional regulator with XRE-family HTH domain